MPVSEKKKYKWKNSCVAWMRRDSSKKREHVKSSFEEYHLPC